MKSSVLSSAALLAVAAQAQQSAYGQCGGEGYTGETTCVSGYYCNAYSDWYSQCIEGTASDSSSTVASTTPPSSTVASTSATVVASTSTTAPVSSSTTAPAPSTTLATSTVASSSTTAVASTSAVASSSAVVSSTVKDVSTSTSASASASGTGFKWFGVDESGAEFGTAIPGVYDTDFIFPSTSSIDTLMGQGFNIFRLPFLMERMAVGTMTATLDADYLANYTAVVDYITAAGGWAIVDPHNFGRYDGAIITSTSDFQTFWTNLATQYETNTQVIFDTNNEYHDMDESLVLSLNQAAIDGIRSTSATTQYIFVEGNSYSGAWTWNTTNDALSNLTDPSNMIIYEMHQYLDSDGSGTSSTCVSDTIGVERVEGATAWLQANGKLGILGEFAGGANADCMSAVTGMLDHMKENSDVWLGALWWGGGPWWGDSYIFGFEPPSGTIGYDYYDTTLETYTP